VSAETQKGRVAAFIATEWNRLVASVRGWIDDAADRDAEDVVQDVVERMFETADVTDPVADISAYVYRSLRNKVIDLYRRPKRSVELPEDLADIRAGFEEEMEIAEMTEEMFEAIDELPQAQREVLVATELEGRSFKELAEQWRVPLGTLLARKHRAILSLRETLTGGEA
jgi:RNA polymerase sigma factor (sigma-70 family)